MTRSFILDVVNDIDLTKYVNESIYWNDLAVKCGFKLTPAARPLGTFTIQGKSKAHLIKRMDEIGISYTHIKLLRAPVSQAIAKFKHKRLCTKRLRSKLKQAGVLYECALCRCEGMTLEGGQWIWNNIELKLVIDHINRVDATDVIKDNVSNIRYLCPNCHTQTPTFCGKRYKN